MCLAIGTLPEIASAQPGTSHWKFEETSGTTVLDANGSNHGALVNGITRLSPGRIGNALRFDGIDDYTTVPDAVSLEATRFSVAVWVRRTGVQTDWAKIISKGGLSSSPWGSYKFEFAGSSDSIVNWHIGFTDLTAAVARGVTQLGDGQWTHLVGTYDGTAARLYVNGTLNASTTVAGKMVRFDTVPLIMGGAYSSFRGDLDEVRYFNYALSAAEVQAVYSATNSWMTVSSPNTATIWLIGSVRSITWTHNLPAGSTSKIDVSRDGGDTWTLVASGIENSTASGSYNWTVTGSATTQARVRVTATNGSAGDVSDAPFTIADATIAVTSPNLSSVVWTSGQSATVTWTSNLTGQENVKIELSTNGGATYPIVMTTSTPSDGVQTFTVSSTWVTSTARVRISWLKNPARFDVSDASFKVQSAALTTVTFQPTSATFPNPERGFTTWWDLSYPDFSWVVSRGQTLARPVFRLDNYRTSPLPQSFLNLLASGFQKARQAGVKLVPRFSYNFPVWINSDPDASQAQIVQHLQQLAPVLAANQDVIAWMEAGFIGLWGEWHTSSHGLDTDPLAKAAILNALLAALPPSRMVALRMPSDMQLLNGPPITSAEAFTGSSRARVGSHQDCFLASDDDWGTWGRSGNSIAYDKAYVAENGKYAVVGGETCYPNPPRSECPTALSELAYLHWTYLNSEFEPTVLQGWVTGGCYAEIDRRLGYRFRLVSASHSQSVQRGQALQLSVQLVNDGFAAMLNKRPVFAVLYKGAETYTCQLNADPRRWSPNAVTTITGACVLPTTMTSGTYSWALWLPDDAPSIRNDPRYAVRFANQGLWNATLGYNVLSTTVTVTP
ncbi:MAG: DUF4832 domain-containing protein [Vicinamibacterales bacterium]